MASLTCCHRGCNGVKVLLICAGVSHPGAPAQLCINIANEQLQFYFNQHIFAWEQEEYAKENINVKEVPFSDNKPLLDMFLTRNTGLLDILNEESFFPGATDKSLAAKLHKQFKGQKKRYIAPKVRHGELAVGGISSARRCARLIAVP